MALYAHTAPRTVGNQLLERALDRVGRQIERLGQLGDRHWLAGNEQQALDQLDGRGRRREIEEWWLFH
jgi:hypothetical protein